MQVGFQNLWARTKRKKGAGSESRRHRENGDGEHFEQKTNIQRGQKGATKGGYS